MARIFTTFIIHILILYLRTAVASVCVSENPCLCQLDEYSSIDLTAVSKNLKDDTFLEDDAGTDRFFFHGCTDGILNAAKYTNKTNDLHKGSLIQVHIDVNNASNNFVKVVGLSKNIAFAPVADQKGFYQIVYNNPNVTACIQLVCVGFKDTVIKVKSTESPTLLLTLFSPHVCIQVHHSGLSTGSVLCLIFFISLGIYFIGGATLLYFIRGARGLEMIPNIDFWRSLPGLVKDGLIFIFSGCNAGAISTPETYDRI